jgi:hypothetical protein
MSNLPPFIERQLRHDRCSFITREFAENFDLDAGGSYTLDGDPVGIAYDLPRDGYVLVILDAAYHARAVASIRAALEDVL